ncbi:MAG: hypothetical protein J5584_07995 [Clostridia bacterium]|nr:hypothetical protein [Clostridia bacterium]
MFSDPDPNHAVENRDLEVLAGGFVWWDDYRVLYRCKKCGAYVMYSDVWENSFLGWDNQIITDTYCPIEDPTAGGDPEKYFSNVIMITDARVIRTQYWEEHADRESNWEYSDIYPESRKGQIS